MSVSKLVGYGAPLFAFQPLCKEPATALSTWADPLVALSQSWGHRLEPGGEAAAMVDPKGLLIQDLGIRPQLLVQVSGVFSELVLSGVTCLAVSWRQCVFCMVNKKTSKMLPWEQKQGTEGQGFLSRRR